MCGIIQQLAWGLDWLRHSTRRRSRWLREGQLAISRHGKQPPRSSMPHTTDSGDTTQTPPNTLRHQRPPLVPHPLQARENAPKAPQTSSQLPQLTRHALANPVPYRIYPFRPLPACGSAPSFPGFYPRLQQLCLQWLQQCGARPDGALPGVRDALSSPQYLLSTSPSTATRESRDPAVRALLPPSQQAEPFTPLGLTPAL